MMMLVRFRFNLAIALFAISGASGQTYKLDWFGPGGGGGTSTGGVYAVSGTFGEPEATQKPMTGANASLTGGFWSIFPVENTATPLLFIERDGENHRVFWPLQAGAFLLDQSITLTGTWSQVAFPYTTNGTDVSVTFPAEAEAMFYRLRKP